MNALQQRGRGLCVTLMALALVAGAALPALAEGRETAVWHGIDQGSSYVDLSGGPRWFIFWMDSGDTVVIDVSALIPDVEGEPKASWGDGKSQNLELEIYDQWGTSPLDSTTGDEQLAQLTFYTDAEEGVYFVKVFGGNDGYEAYLDIYHTAPPSPTCLVNVDGYVYDAVMSGQGIPGARVTMDGWGSVHAITNGAGYYQFENMHCNAVMPFLITADGYADKSQEIRVDAGYDTPHYFGPLNFSLFPDEPGEGETPPEPHFEPLPDSGVAPLAVMFRDLSNPGDGTITSWEWDFGDGFTSSKQHPVHVFYDTGTFNVCLTVTSSHWGQPETACELVTVTAPDPGGRSFSALVDVDGDEPEEVFVPAQGSIWFTFRAEDNENLSVTVTPESGSEMLAFVEVFLEGATTPVASATALNSGEAVSLELLNTVAGNYYVRVTDLSKSAKNGGAADVNVACIGNCAARENVVCYVKSSVAPNDPIPDAIVTILYMGMAPRYTDAEGKCAFKLAENRAINFFARHAHFQPSGEADYMVLSGPNTVTLFLDPISAPIVVNFTGDPRNGTAPLEVQFTDISVAPTGENIVQWQWSFGDGGNSSVRHPLHTYGAPGTYDVSLTATTNMGSAATRTKPLYIGATQPASGPIANFTASPRGGKKHFLEVQFTDTSSLGVYNTVSWLWDFGDGATSVARHPMHEYIGFGAYTVSLTVVTDGGSDTLTRTNYIVLRSGEGMPASGAVALTLLCSVIALAGATRMGRRTRR